MTIPRYLRVAHPVAVRPDDGLDLVPVAGDFACAAAVPGGISRVCSEPRDGALRVRAFGHGDPYPVDLGEVGADAVFADAPGSRAGYAFLATLDDGQVCRRLQTYQGFGVFVVHGFHSFRDGRQDYFTREFYVAASAAAMGSAAKRWPSRPLRVGRAEPGDPSALFGRWTNLNRAATGVAELVCRPVGSGMAVRVRAVGEAADWGETLADLYADATDLAAAPALLVTYDRGFMRVHLQARINRGVLVVAQYAEYADGSGRSNFMMRECFCC